MRSVIVVLALLLPVVGFAAESKLFSRLDTDKSGTISKDELLKSDLVVVQGPNGQKQVVLRDMAKDPKAVKMSEEQKNRLFEQIDTDKRFTPIRNLLGYYYYVEVYKFQKVDMCSESANLVKLYDEKEKHKNIVYEMVLHPNGNLNGSWVDNEDVLNPYCPIGQKRVENF